MLEREQEMKNEGLAGFITERHFDVAEQEFPGITRFYQTCTPRPATFLDLLSMYGAFQPS
jgi:hypothetical protein